MNDKPPGSEQWDRSDIVLKNNNQILFNVKIGFNTFEIVFLPRLHCSRPCGIMRCNSPLFMPYYGNEAIRAAPKRDPANYGNEAATRALLAHISLPAKQCTRHVHCLLTFLCPLRPLNSYRIAAGLAHTQVLAQWP